MKEEVCYIPSLA